MWLADPDIPEPNLSNFYEGEHVFEWWHAERKVIIYMANVSVGTLIRVWGPNIDTQMSDHDLTDPERIRESFRWLYAPGS